jgi:putative tricarboxylic transport membrane protein
VIWQAWWTGFASLVHPAQLLLLALGMAYGLFVGALPGIGGATAIALAVPLTYGMDSFGAIAFACGVMGAVPMGSSITAILLNTPGAAPSAATLIDGYPLARQGKAGLAIGAAASSNAIGGLIGTMSVLVVMPLARRIVLLFRPPEFFLLGMLGLVVVALSSRGKMLRGLVTAGLGLMIACIGQDLVTGELRFTLGSQYLWSGVRIVPALIGLFAIAEMINLSIKGGAVVSNADARVKVERMSAGLIETLRHWPTVLRGSLIGTVVGAVPGVGGTVAAFLSYSITSQVSKQPETFGKGNIEGVIAAESAINASDGSHLIPTLGFGVPAGAEMAVFLGILMLHGLQPGPAMLIDHQAEIYGIVWALTFACVLASFIGLVCVRPLAAITTVPTRVLVPIVVCLALVGSYSVDQSIGNVIVSGVFGVLGYVLIRQDYPRLTIVIGMVLGGIIERSYHQSLMMSDGRWGIFVASPIAMTLAALIVAALVVPPARLAVRKAMGA